MVGHKLLDALVERGGHETWQIVTFAEETRPAYDRVGLSSYFDGARPTTSAWSSDGFFERNGITVHLGDRVAAIDREATKVRLGRRAR